MCTGDRQKSQNTCCLKKVKILKIVLLFLKHFSFVLFFQKKVVQLVTLPALLPTEFISDIQDVKRKTVLQN